MKQATLLLLTLLFSTSAFAADDAISGTWAGPASSESGPFNIALQIKDGSSGMSVMNWGSGQCVGNLSGGAEGNGVYVYTLRITQGRRNTPEETGCLDGTVRLVLDGERKVRYSWSGVDVTGRATSSTAVLEKQ